MDYNRADKFDSLTREYGVNIDDQGRQVGAVARGLRLQFRYVILRTERGCACKDR